MKICLNGRTTSTQLQVAKEFIMNLEPTKMTVGIDGSGQPMQVDINEFLAAIDCVRSYYNSEAPEE